MKKNVIMYLLMIIVTIIFIYGFSSSYKSNNMENIAYVTALGIDLNEDGKNLKITFEFMDISSFSSGESSKSSKPILDNVIAPSVSSAINLINGYTGKEVNLAHCKVIIFSEDIAKKGILPEVTELMNNIQVRPTTNIIVSKCTAVEYIQQSVSKVEKVLTKYYDIFVNSSEYTGYTSDITIGEFYNYLLNDDCGNLAILGGLNKESLPEPSDSSEQGNSESSNSSESSGESKESEGSGGAEKDKNLNEQDISSEKEAEMEVKENKDEVSTDTIVSGNSPIIGQRGTENIGLAVFNKDKYVGDLTATETLCHTLITGEVNSGLITVKDKENNSVDIELVENTQPKIDVDVSGENPVITIYIKVNGPVVGLNKLNGNLPEKDLGYFSKSVDEHLENKITEFLNKTISEYKCDINGFYKYAKHNFKTISEWNQYNWSEKYLKSEFRIFIDSQIYSTILNSE